MENQTEREPDLNSETAQLFQNLSLAMMNALNGSMAAAELLSRKLEREEQRESMEYLAILRHDQHKLLHIAQNLNELAALSLGEITLARDAIELNILCGELADTVAALQDQVNIEFLPCRDRCTTLGDMNRLEQLILNLISNSLLHCGPGNTIQIQVTRVDKTLYVAVRDDGSGIKPGVLPSLFADVKQDPDNLDVMKGAGLSLRVSEGIARLHGGTLLVTSRPEGGAEALLALPVRWDNRLGLPTGVYGKRIRGVLTALSEALSRDRFMPPYL